MATRKFTAKRKLRKIKVLVGGTPGRSARMISYPMFKFKGPAPLPDLSNYFKYDMPVYPLTASGTDAKGNPVSKSWDCFRFGVYLNDGSNPHYKAKGFFVAGLAMAQKHIVHKYNPEYRVHSSDSPENGSWVVTGSFLIHDGPDHPGSGQPEDLFGSIGCVEVQGVKGFTSFNDFVISISGSRKTGIDALNEIAEAGVMEVEYEAASRPPLQEIAPP